MSNDEIERRLSDLEPVPPRTGLRTDVLEAVQAELDTPEVNRLDRFLARRAPWAVAAASLVALFGANWLLQRHVESKGALRRTAITSDARSMMEYRAWLGRRAIGDHR